MKGNSKTTLITLSFFIALVLIAGYWFVTNYYNKKSEFDIPNKENNKIVAMFDTQIKKQLDNYTKSNFYPGYIATSRQRAITFLNSISIIESYARYGVTSTQSRNNLELKLTFANGTVVDKIYTGSFCSGYFEPHLIVKIIMNNGKTEQVFTNGAEKKDHPTIL